MATVKNNQARVQRLGLGIRLLPGINLNVDQKELDKALKTKAVKALVEEGHIVILESEKPTDLSKMELKEALAFVKQIVDPVTLKKLAEVEKRKMVSDAIAAQLKAITPEEKKTETK